VGGGYFIGVIGKGKKFLAKTNLGGEKTNSG
jgi:hypothetical protein